MDPSPTLVLIRRRLNLSALFVFNSVLSSCFAKKVYQRSTAVLKPLNATDYNVLIISPRAKNPEHRFDLCNRLVSDVVMHSNKKTGP